MALNYPLVSSSIWLATAALGVGWGLAQPYPSLSKWLGFGSAVFCSSVAAALSQSSLKQSERLIIRQDTADQIFDIGEAAIIERYKQAVMPIPKMPDLNIHNHVLGMFPESPEQETATDLDFYNWDDLQHEANALIVGGNPGSGKSTVVGGFLVPMLSRLAESEIIICDPDASANRWREYGYTRIVSDYMAIYSTLMAVAEEKERRKATGKGHQIILVLDELNDCQGAWKSKLEGNKYNQAIEAIRTLGNARKYNITPVILMQSHNVEDIGLSKKYRNQFAVILICASARDLVQNLWQKNDPRQQWVNSNPYPVVLTGSIPTQIAQHPTHGHHAQFKKVGNAPTNILTPVCADIQSIPDFQNSKQDSVYQERQSQSIPRSQPTSIDLSKSQEIFDNERASDDKFMQILEFAKQQGSVSIRDIQRSSVGRNLSSNAVKYAFEWLAENGYGEVKEEQVGGVIRVAFVPW